MAAPAIVSPHILTIGGSSYDLRKVVMWAPHSSPTSTGDQVSVMFQTGDEHIRVILNADTFLTAKAASLAAGG